MKKLQLLLVALALVSFTFYSCGNVKDKAEEAVEDAVEEVVEAVEEVEEVVADTVEVVAEEAEVEEAEEAPAE